jgi:ABC-type polysaccharide/polyol phosphate transport system ATPase subunit
MSGDIAVEFQGVSKSFSRHKAQGLIRQKFWSWLQPSTDKTRFFALKNISFQLRKGESLAIVGTNGAGKSTLLSLVAGLSHPDCGIITVTGRIAALFELGSGFHQDLTGAENIAMNAALLGFTRKQTRDLFPSIVEFSELGDFLDEPLRTYSSGMIMRLAFSVAINLNPDILITDEIMAVGDHAFQAKCFEKIQELRNSGCTMLFVSHAPGMVQQLCDRALWLDAGELMMSGPLDEVIAAYHGRVRIS